VEVLHDDAAVTAEQVLAPLPHAAGRPISFFRQVLTHVKRNRRQLLREPALAKLRVGSATALGLALGILYFDMENDLSGVNDRVSLLLFSMLFLSIVNAIPVVVAVVPELTVVKKEVRNNWYVARSWIPAKIAIETPLLILPPGLFLVVCGFMSGLAKSESGERFFMLWLAVVLVVMCTHSWALTICGLAPSLDVAFLAAPGSIMPMAVLSGFFVNVTDMSWVFRWFTYINYLNYGWQAMAYAGFYGLTFVDSPYPTGEAVLTERLALPRSDAAGFWENVAILVAFVFFFRALGIFVISRKLSK